MGKFEAIVFSAYTLAGVALFATGTAPVITPSTDFHGDSFAIAWAGWKFSGCLYMALVQWGVPLGSASALTMVPYIAFDIYAALDTQHWTALTWSFVVLELFTAATALMGKLKIGGAINAAYVLAGLALFTTGTAPVVQPEVDFFGQPFAMAWAGWKFSGCLYYALLNLGVHSGLSMATAMVPYVAFDWFAVHDPAHWTPLAWSFIVLDGVMGVLGLAAFLSDGSRQVKKHA